MCSVPNYGFWSPVIVFINVAVFYQILYKDLSQFNFNQLPSLLSPDAPRIIILFIILTHFTTRDHIKIKQHFITCLLYSHLPLNKNILSTDSTQEVPIEQNKELVCQGLAFCAIKIKINNKTIFSMFNNKF